jgi:hypothetical protein
MPGQLQRVQGIVMGTIAISQCSDLDYYSLDQSGSTSVMQICFQESQNIAQNKEN